MMLEKEKAMLLGINYNGSDGELLPLQHLQTSPDIDANMMREISIAVKTSQAVKTSPLTGSVQEMTDDIEHALCGNNGYINRIQQVLETYCLWSQKSAVFISSTFGAYDNYYQCIFAFVERVDANVVNNDVVNAAHSIELQKPLAAIVVENKNVFVLERSRRARDILTEFAGIYDSEINNGVASTTDIVDAMRSYANKIGLDNTESQELFAEIQHELLERDGTPTLNDLDELITSSTGDETKFSEHAKKSGFKINLDAPIKKRILSQLVKCQGKGGGISVGFDSKLLGERVHYNSESNQLVIDSPPPCIVAQIKSIRASHE